MSAEVTNLYETIYEIYLKNLSFLEENFPEIFEKVIVLEQSINTNQYQAKYELELINDSFNIVNLETKEYLYTQNSYEKSEQILNNITLSKDSSILLFETQYESNYLSKQRIIKELHPLLDHINDINLDDKYHFTKLYKYMFVGIGLGIHIPYIQEKFNLTSVFIVEPNIEIFRLSLFVTPYFELDKKTKIFFSIAENRASYIKSAKSFFNYQPYLNYMIKHHLFEPSYHGLLSDIVSIFINSHSSFFSYKVQLLGFERTLTMAKKRYQFLQIKPMLLSKRFKKYPTLIISAGPSTKYSIDWIKDNQKKFYIVAVDTIIPFLAQHKIEVDIIVSIDPGNISHKCFKGNIKSYIKNKPIIAPSQVSNSLLKRFNKKQVFLFQAYNVFPQLGQFLSSANVGTYALHLAVLMGSKNIYTLGNDASFDQNDGAVYSDSVVNHKIILDNDDKVSSTIVSKRDDLYTVKGNLTDKVKTTRKLLAFKNDYETSVKYITKNFKCKLYNFSNGVYIEGFEPQDTKKINMEEFSKLKKYNLCSYFERHSVKNMNIDFCDDLETLNKIIKLVKKLKKKKIVDRNQLIHEQLKTLVEILDYIKHMSIDVFGSFFMEYLELSGIFFYFYLNVEGKHLYDRKKLTQLKTIWCESALSMLEEMKNNLEEDDEND
jgi:hypothetical protein